MILPKPKDAKHKIQLYRVLTAILENNYLANTIYFKGGTYASMRGVLTRFSVDLDFDLLNKKEKEKVKRELEKIFRKLGMKIKDQSRHELQFFLGYQAPDNERNTLKVEVTDLVSPANEYESVSLTELGLICKGQTIPTMVANKMYATIARYEKTGHIAGRDFYDLHQFLLQGLVSQRVIVEERTGKKYRDYLQELIKFTNEKLSDEELFQDLNALLPVKELGKVVKRLKRELVILLTDEYERSS
ncbi:MAG: nucleotidyl transferase AbiEii/AbiGii toxin family protein [bacterium]